MTKTISVKKMYLGKVSIRDYIVNDMIEKGVTVRIKFRGDVMTLTPEDLKKGKSNGYIFKAKFGSKPRYKLIDFKWIEDKEPEAQMRLKI